MLSMHCRSCDPYQSMTDSNSFLQYNTIQMCVFDSNPSSDSLNTRITLIQTFHLLSHYKWSKGLDTAGHNKTKEWSFVVFYVHFKQWWTHIFNVCKGNKQLQIKHYRHTDNYIKITIKSISKAWKTIFAAPTTK